MTLKKFTTELKDISKEKTFRNDVDFINFQDELIRSDFYSFSDLFSFSKENKVDTSTLDYDFYYSEITNVSKIGEVTPVKLNLLNREDDKNDYYKKIDKGDIIKVSKGDILLSKVRPNLKKYVFIDDEKKKYFFTSAFIHLVPKKLNKILYYCFSSIFYKNIVAISRQGKGYPTLKEDDFFSLRLNKKSIDYLLINESTINKKIDEIEKEIEKIKIKSKTQDTIINDVFSREFGFNIKKFEKITKTKLYSLNFSSFANNIDLRQSVKFHREAGDFVISELSKISVSKIKYFISEPIVLGSSVSPSDYDEKGTYFYVSMANIKNWKFEDDEAKLVSDDYSSKITKTLQKNDILIARSGEGTIGKVAIIEDDLKGIFADFTMRIRFKNYDPMFAYYYFRTSYFQYLIEINKKGLGNNTNIFPSQIQELPILDIPLNKQKEIVDEIKEEINKQNIYIKNIEKERAKISEIIEKSIN